MKRTMLALLVGALLCTGAQAQVPGEALGFALLEKLYQEGQGVLISPWGLALSLTMAKEGARGESLAELTGLLGDLPFSAQVAPGVSCAAVALYDPQIAPLDSYRQALAAYGANLMPGLSINAINAWVKEHTAGMIDPMLDGPLPEDARLALISAIALDAQWAMPFEEYATHTGVFHAPQGDVEAQFMHRNDDIRYAQNQDLQLLHLPYEGGKLSCYLILPPQGAMDGALARLKEDGYGLFNGLSFTDLRLAMPKLSLEKDYTLNDALRQMGLRNAMSMDADFSGIDGTQCLKLGPVVQKSRLDVNEGGTRAASATVVYAIDKAAMMEADPVEVILDRPFVLLIRDETTGYTLFAACVTAPQTSQIN